jgi:hypothetical protein
MPTKPIKIFTECLVCGKVGQMMVANVMIGPYTHNCDVCGPETEHYWSECPPGCLHVWDDELMVLDENEIFWPTVASCGVTGGPVGLAGGSGNRKKLFKITNFEEARGRGCGELSPEWTSLFMGLNIDETNLSHEWRVRDECTG